MIFGPQRTISRRRREARTEVEPTVEPLPSARFTFGCFVALLVAVLDVLTTLSTTTRHVQTTNRGGHPVELIRSRRWRNGRLQAGYLDVTNGRWVPSVAGAAGFTLNWAGTVSATWSTIGNWIDQATGVAWVSASAPSNAELCRLGTGTGATNNACTTTAGDVCGELNVNDAYTGTLTLASSATALAVGGASLGACRFGTGMTLTSGANAVLTLVATSNNGGAGFSVTNSGKSPRAVTFNGAGGKWSLVDGLTTAIASDIVLTAGTLVTNGQTLDMSRFIFTGALTRSLDCTNSTINLESNTATTPWSVSGSNFTLTATGSTIVIVRTSASTRTFAGGGATYGTLTYTVAGSTGQLSVTGSNTFTTINFSDVTNARTLQFTNATTTTITTTLGFNVQGTSGKLMTVQSSSAGSAFTLSLTGRAEVAFCSIKDSTVTQTLAAFAQNSTDVSGNTRWVFVGTTVSSSETGSGVDAQSTLSTFSSADTGSGADTNGSIGLSTTDSGAGVDAGTPAPSFAFAESGSGVDSGSLAPAVADSESASSVDGGSLAPAIAAAESATATDAGSLAPAVTSAESVAATDDASVSVAQSSVDRSAGDDTESLAPSITASDSSTVDDDGSLAAQASASESSAGDDGGSTVAAVSSSEAVTTTDDADLAAVLAAAEQSIIDDAASILAEAAADELAGGADDVGGLLAALLDLDSGAGVDDGAVANIVLVGDLCWTILAGTRWLAANGDTQSARVGAGWSAMMGECVASRSTPPVTIGYTDTYVDEYV